jgi:hypothetical protein
MSNDLEWMPQSPCESCCDAAYDHDREICKLYAYDLDCVYLACYKSNLATLKAYTEWEDEFCSDHAATGYVGGNNRTHRECPKCREIVLAQIEKEAGR